MYKDYQVINVDPDITEAGFVQILQSAGSPVPADQARKVYQFCVKRRVSPLFILGMFNKESGFGKNGWAAKTFSWGNTRPPSFGYAMIGSYNQDTGVFYKVGVPIPSGRYLSAYVNWEQGGISTVARLTEHTPYEGKTTVRQIISTWAPPSDGNNTELYINQVLGFIGGKIGVGFPGALTQIGSVLLGGVDFGGVLTTVAEVTVRGINADGTRYERTWRLDGMQPWGFWQ